MEIERGQVGVFYPGGGGHAGAYSEEVVRVHVAGVVEALAGGSWGSDVKSSPSWRHGSPQDPGVLDAAGVKDFTTLSAGVHL